MFRNFKHKPLEVSAVEVTPEYVRSLDPEAGPLLPQFNHRTGEPQAIEWNAGRESAGVGDFVIERKPGVYQAMSAEQFKSKYDPAW